MTDRVKLNSCWYIEANYLQSGFWTQNFEKKKKKSGFL